jgi:hypothetical protein
MVKKWMKILKNILRFKNKHSPNILLYMSYDAGFYAESEYISILYIQVKLTIISAPKLN